MSKNWNRSLAVAALGTLIAVAAFAAPGPRPGGPPQGGPDEGHGLPDPGRLAAYLQLDEAQRETFRGLVEAMRETTKPLREEQRELFDRMKELLESDSPNPADIGAVVLEIHGIREEIEAARETFDEQLSAILDANQLARWENLQRWLASHKRRGPGGPDEPEA